MPDLISEFAARNHLPTMYDDRDGVEEGGLMSYYSNPLDVRRRAATFVDKILKGAKPSDMPVERPTRFDLGVNLKTAKAHGLTIPPAVLARANEIIHPMIDTIGMPARSQFPTPIPLQTPVPRRKRRRYGIRRHEHGHY
jgi:hypothetical protein